LSKTIFSEVSVSGYGYFDTSSFIYQDTSSQRQWSDLFGLRVKLPPVTTILR